MPSAKELLNNIEDIYNRGMAELDAIDVEASVDYSERKARKELIVSLKNLISSIEQYRTVTIGRPVVITPPSCVKEMFGYERGEYICGRPAWIRVMNTFYMCHEHASAGHISVELHKRGLMSYCHGATENGRM